MNLDELGRWMELELAGAETLNRTGKVVEVIGTLVRARAACRPSSARCATCSTPTAGCCRWRR